MCCVWYCSNISSLERQVQKVPSQGRWMGSSHWSATVDRRRSVALWFCAAGCEPGGFEFPSVHTHPTADFFHQQCHRLQCWMLAWGMPCVPRVPFSPGTSPGALHLPTTSLLWGSLPPWALGWERSAALPSLPHLDFGLWEEAGRQD